MAQGKFKKTLAKIVRKGDKGYPVASIAFYGPDNLRASKVVCGIIEEEGAEPEKMKKWFSESDVMRSEAVLEEVLAFIKENGVATVSMVESIIGCPHEEGIDYPEGESCPQCPYWKNRDRFTHELLH